MRAVLPRLGGDLVQYGCRNADIGDDNLAAMKAPRHQHMGRLLAEERHRKIGVDIFSIERLAGIARDALRSGGGAKVLDAFIEASRG